MIQERQSKIIQKELIRKSYQNGRKDNQENRKNERVPYEKPTIKERGLYQFLEAFISYIWLLLQVSSI